MKKNWIPYLVGYLVFGFALFYFTLPSLNFHDPEFWIYFNVMFILLIFGLLVLNVSDPKKVFVAPTKMAKYGGLAILVSVATPFIIALITSSIFNAKEYANRIDVEMSEFSTINEVDFTKTPIIDRDTTEAIGDRVMGEMTDLVSQFNVSEEYTQISYKDSVYRVTPLEYASFIKWFTNKDEGIPAYITVDSTNGKATLVELSSLNLDNMEYVPSAFFNKNLYRQLRFKYPTVIFGSPSFELDEQGHPWYVCTTYTYKGVGTKKSVTGAIFLDPITGDTIRYDVNEIPAWADRIYPEDLVIQEIDNYGSLQDGFINSIIGQKGVIQTSDGYNYLEKDGDIWLYTGITSVNKDSSNLGFILANLRTHQVLRIPSPGADENSARRSAQDEVKNYGYEATFPILVNINGYPTYLMSLRAPMDEESETKSVIKMYAMVDVADYQKVVVVGVDEGLNTLKKKMIELQTTGEVSPESLTKKTITVSHLEKIFVDGNTKYYFMDEEGNRYKIDFSIKYEDKLAFLKNGDTLTIEYSETEGIMNITSIEE